MRRTTAIRSGRLARPLASVAVLALVSAFAAGCGDDSGDSDDGADDEPEVAVTALTPDQIAEGVLQSDNMGDGWTSEPSTEDDSTAPGCLANVETLTDGLEEKDKGGTKFSYEGTSLTVESTISAYDDEPGLTAVFDQVQVAVAACTTVTGPDGDGNTWDLTLTSSDEAVYDDVDDQYSVSGTGTFTTPEGENFEVYLEQTAVRLGPNVASVNTIDINSRTTEHATWAEIAVERFVDVAEGDEPDGTTAPAPG